MRRSLFAAVLFLSASASSQEYIPGSSNDLQVFLEDLAAAQPPAPVEAVPAVLAVPSLKLKERWPRKHYTYDLMVSSTVLGVITGTERGYELRDAAGKLLASTKDILIRKGERIIKVNDGSGAHVGTISMTHKRWCGQKTFELYDADNALVSASGTVAYDQDVITLGDAEFTMKRALLSRWTLVPGTKADRRLTLFVIPYNEAADIE